MTAWIAAALTICGATALAVCALLAHWLWRRWQCARRERLALREDANGRALLWLAQDIERHARLLQRLGETDDAHRHWAALCRRIATEHLACINALLLDAGPGAALLRDGIVSTDAPRARHADIARSGHAS